MDDNLDDENKTEKNECKLNDKSKRDKSNYAFLDPLNIFVGIIDVIKNIFK